MGERWKAIAGFAGIGLVAYVMSGATKDATVTSPCDQSSDAIAASTDLVREYLKAPSSASFPNSAMATALKRCEFDIIGKVDSQNSFGAMLRSTYTMRVVYDEKQRKWAAYDVVIQ
ncbi:MULTISPECIES: hypothetical protein [unclassified Rhizobium]|uniref:hypothetical protein n=1 Tax=unclassified Rhizobium TaxID=2613769 RepID=UPI001AEA883D|nr:MULTISPECIES: hypothetical protein [unclassified Rhizobium]MBP2459584.1 hypothetical protein [Rhizobium sp. PvP014]MBP2531878.1 hypothetical protein [Rhizobium sp. PvP099]